MKEQEEKKTPAMFEIKVPLPKKDKKSSVIIVGNSPAILEKEMGDFIDSHDVVIRLNRCVTEGFEKYIGSKIDIWATSSWCLEESPDNLVSELTHEYPYWVPPYFDEIKSMWYRTPETRTDFKRSYHRLYNIITKAKQLPERRIDEAHFVMYKTPEFRNWFPGYWAEVEEKGRHKKMEVVMKKSHADWCTGMLAILNATIFYEDVSVYGFTFYNESEGDVTCYYRDSELDENGNHKEDVAWARAKGGYDTAFISDNATAERHEILKDLESKGLLKIIK